MGTLLLVVASVLAACGAGDAEVSQGTVESVSSFTPALDGLLVEWKRAGGECPECAYVLGLQADGDATFESAAGTSDLAYDASSLRADLNRLDPTDLVVGRDDCGREVDGDAPVLVLHQNGAAPLVIDSCYETIDREHPLIVLVLELLERTDHG